MANKCISCNNCGHIGWSKNKGSFLITIVLLIFFFIPGLIYEIWRNIGLGACKNCGSTAVIPSDQCQEKSKKIQINTFKFFVGLISIGGALYIGALLLVVAYVSINHFIETGEFRTKSPDQLFEACYKEGLKHYQSIGQYPMLADGKTLTMDKIQVECKNSTTGKYLQ